MAKKKRTDNQKAYDSYRKYVKNVRKLESQGFAYEKTTSYKEYKELYKDAIKAGKTSFFARKLALEDRIIGGETAKRILKNFNERQREIAKESKKDYKPLTLNELKRNIRKLETDGVETEEAAVMITPLKVMVKQYDDDGNFLGWKQEEIMPTSTKQMIYLLQKFDQEGRVIKEDGEIKVEKYYGY